MPKVIKNSLIARKVRKAQDGAVLDPNSPALPEPTAVPQPEIENGNMHSFMQEHDSDNYDRSGFDDETTARVNNLMNSYNMMLSDAVKGVTNARALHVDSRGDALVPTDAYEIDVDMNTLRQDIANKKGISNDRRIQLGRSLQVIQQAKDKNFKIMGSKTSDRFWLESTEADGTKRYAVNGIIEVSDVLDEFRNKTPQIKDEEESTTPEQVVEEKGIEEIQAASDKDNTDFTEIETLRMGELGLDFASTIAGILAKMSGAGAPVGMGISAVGGLGALGMGAYADHLDPNVSTGELLKNAGIRLGLEALETFTIAPVSLIGRLNKVSKTGKLLRKGINIAFAGAGANELLRGEYLELLDKPASEWGVDDYRKLSFVVQTVAGVAAGRVGRGKNVKDIAGKQKIVGQSKSINRKKVIDAETVTPAARRQKLESSAEFKAHGKKARTEITEINKNKKAIIGSKATKTTPRSIGTAGETHIATIKNKKAEMATKIAAAEKKHAAPALLNGAVEKPAVKAKRESDLAAEIDKIKKAHSKSKLIAKKQYKGRVEAATKDAKAKSTAARNAKHAEERSMLMKEARKVSKARIEGAEKIQAKNEKTLEKSKKRAKDIYGKSVGNKLIKKGQKKGGFKAEKKVKEAPVATKAVAVESDKLKQLKKDKAALSNKIKKNKGDDGKIKPATDEQKAALKKLNTSINKEKTKLLPRAKAKMRAKVESVKEKGAKATKALSKLRGAHDVMMPRDGVGNMSQIRAFTRTKLVSGDRYKGPANNDELYDYFVTEKGYTTAQLEKFTERELQKAYVGMKRADKEGKKFVPKKRAGGLFTEPVSIRKKGGILYVAGTNVQKARKGLPIHPGFAVTPTSSEISFFRSWWPFDSFSEARKESSSKAWRAKEAAKNFAERDRIANIAAQAANAKALGLPVDNGILENVPYTVPTVRDVLTNRINDVTHPELLPVKPKLIGRDVDNSLTTDITPDADNYDVTHENEKKELSTARTPEEAQAIKDKYAALRLRLDALKDDPEKYNTAIALLKNIKPSDLFASNKIFEEVVPYHSMAAPVSQAGPITNMPGIGTYLRQLSHSPRRKSADASMSHEISRRQHNKLMDQRGKLSAANAEYIQGRREQARNIKNQNTAAAVNANNINAQERNKYNLMTAQQRVQNLAARHATRQKQWGQATNQLFSNAQDVVGNKQKAALADQYTGILKKKGIWDSNYAIRFNQAMEEGKDSVGALAIKNEFMEAENYNPDNFQADIASLNTKYKTYG